MVYFTVEQAGHGSQEEAPIWEPLIEVGDITLWNTKAENVDEHRFSITYGNTPPEEGEQYNCITEALYYSKLMLNKETIFNELLSLHYREMEARKNIRTYLDDLEEYQKKSESQEKINACLNGLRKNRKQLGFVLARIALLFHDEIRAVVKKYQ